MPSDHLLTCGENRERLVQLGVASGPSPPMWGKRPEVDLALLVPRSIPTHVGKTKARHWSCGAGSVHPHPRGENFCCEVALSAAFGPSPPTWGKLARPHHPAPNYRSIPPTWGKRTDGRGRLPHQRFIPTHVGKTWRGTSPNCTASVHPHPRGENSGSSLILNVGHGPSPPTWGKLTVPERVIDAHRSIPTHVGKTREIPYRAAISAVHPHPRGENARTPRVLQRRLGPSPPTWGKRSLRLVSCTTRRSIPTHVGKTLRAASIWAIAAVHPHPRGENDDRGLGVDGHLGPSPPTWGKLELVSPRSGLSRSIPTHVGKTRAEGSARRVHLVHPHPRGENWKGKAEGTAHTGPSPPTWGKPRPLHPRHPRSRSIPTHVGKTPRTAASPY